MSLLKTIGLPTALLPLLVVFVSAIGACSQPGSIREGPEGTTGIHQVELSWDPPKTRADGTAINAEEIGGYRIYYGTSPETMDQVIDVQGGTRTEHVIRNLAARTYYFAIAAYDRRGRESQISEVISKTIEPAEDTRRN